MKVLLVFGTRPEAIKMAPIINLLKKSNNCKITICVTAQHRKMLDQVLELFEIVPDWDLDIMSSGQDLFDITSKVLIGIRGILDAINPDIVLVHGDTTTSMATALASFYKKIEIGHVEAGLRTRNVYSPWPEEINRQITSRIAKWHFAPTELAKKNLLEDGIYNKDIYVTGNTVIDSLFLIKQKIESNLYLNNEIKIYFDKILKFDIKKEKYILVTGHRRENFGFGLLEICKALEEVSKIEKDIHIIYPVHLNPNVQNTVYSILNGIPNIHLIEPLDYLHFVYLMNYSLIIMTDSGGIQEEAPSLGKPVLLMRDTTERPEAIEAGTVEMVGTNKKIIINTIISLINNKDYYNKFSNTKNPYGDGKAAENIVKILENIKK